MLPSSFDLGITEAPTATRVYSLYDDNVPEGCIYNEAGHSFSARDFLLMRRTLPKSNGNSYGVRRPFIKFTRDFTVTDKAGNDVVAPVIYTCEASIPVGVLDADERICRLTLANLLIHTNIPDFTQKLELG